MRKCAAFALLASVGMGAAAQNPKPADVWFSAGHVALSATNAVSGLAAEWQFDRADNGDVRLVKDERRGTARVSGTVLSVCGDQAIIFKDFAPAPRRELQELNEPVLHLQLVLRLLARALPAGLPAAGSETSVDIGDDKNTLRLRKDYSARKDIGAPWRTRGSVRRAAADVRFDLVVTYAADDPPHRPVELKLAGVWAQQSRMQKLDNTFSIAGWRVHRVDAVSEVVGGNTYVDPVARIAPLSFATLGDVRAEPDEGRLCDDGVRAPRAGARAAGCGRRAHGGEPGGSRARRRRSVFTGDGIGRQ